MYVCLSSHKSLDRYTCKGLFSHKIAMYFNTVQCKLRTNQSLDTFKQNCVKRRVNLFPTVLLPCRTYLEYATMLDGRPDCTRFIACDPPPSFRLDSYPFCQERRLSARISSQRIFLPGYYCTALPYRKR